MPEIDNFLRPKSHLGPIFTKKRTMRAAKDCIRANLYDTTHSNQG